MKEILDCLFELRDDKYADFQIKLIPGLRREDFIGVRTPVLRKYAGELCKMDCRDEFLRELPHRYFDENQLHSFIISNERDFDKCIQRVEEFLPYIDNWATCDQLAPKVFKKHSKELSIKIDEWLVSSHTYTVRFGIGMAMSHFLEDEFSLYYPDKISAIRSDEYYINMMIAWYFATALAKQYDDIIPYIKERKLDKWTHNKTIQKAVESNRILPEQKAYLKTLKV